jgi:hypothetical protein
MGAENVVSGRDKAGELARQLDDHAWKDSRPRSKQPLANRPVRQQATPYGGLSTEDGVQLVTVQPTSNIAGTDEAGPV